MSQINNKSSMLGIIFGLGIVVAFIMVLLIIGKDNVTESVEISDTSQHTGKEIYEKACIACHETGVLNAPKLGNKIDWEKRIIKGEDILLQNATNGFNSMPPRGGTFLSDTDLKLAVQYMLAGIKSETNKPETKSKSVEVRSPISKSVEPIKTVDQSAGKMVYNKVCIACHATGILNAPKLGNKDDWQARIDKGEKVLVQNAIKGFNSMPPRGGSFVNDADMQSVVQYMLASVGFETSKSIKKVVPEISKQPISKEQPIPEEQPKEVIKIDTSVVKVPKTMTEPETPKITKVIPEAPKVITEIESTLSISPRQGKDVYDMTCKSCHVVGIAGAPKISEKKDWQQRIIKGKDVLIQNAINGINIMPPKGGNSNLTDEEVKLAVQYMLKNISNR
ncbi:MAG TPA: cytochrome c5 family protein [Thioploca sp.]|nr:cytochrome c5 family protein [Thioploca sp.]